MAERQAMKKKKQVNGKGDLKQLFKSAEGPKPGQQKPPIMILRSVLARMPCLMIFRSLPSVLKVTACPSLTC